MKESNLYIKSVEYSADCPDCGVMISFSSKGRILDIELKCNLCNTRFLGTYYLKKEEKQ